MKTFRKILKIAGIVVISTIVFMLLTVVVAKIFEDDLASFTLEKLETRIDAPLSVGKVSLIPLFSFPRLSAEINQLYIGDPDSRNSDTLFFVNSLKVGLDTWDLIHGIYSIDKLEISGLDFDYQVDSAGKSNIDFLINAFADTATVVEPESVSTPLNLSAEKLTLEDIRIRYYDSLTHMGAEVTIPEITLKAKTKNNIYQGKTSGSFILSHCYFPDTKLDQMQSCTVNFDLKYEDNEAIIQELSVISEGLNLGVEGALKLGDTINLNAAFQVNKLDFNLLKKYIPSATTFLHENEKLAPLDFMSIEINMDYIDNYMQINKMLINNAGLGLDLEGSFKLGDTLEVDAQVQSLHMNFDNLKKYIPGQYFKEFGMVDVGGSLDVSGNMVGKYADSTLLPKVDADLSFKNLKVQTKEYPTIDNANLTADVATGKKSDLSEASLDIYNLDVTSGQSHLNLKGSVAGLENTQYNIRSSMEINLSDFENLIPDSLAQRLQGTVVASVRTGGILPQKLNDDFTDYLLDNTFLTLAFNNIEAMLMDSVQLENLSGHISYTPQGLGAKALGIDSLQLQSNSLNINLQNTSLSAIVSGRMSDLTSLSAQLTSLAIHQGNSHLVANGTVENFEVPVFDLTAHVNLSLNEWMPFVPDSLITQMSGTLAADIHSMGKINPDSLETQLFPLLFENSSIRLALNSISIAFPDSIMDVDELSAQIGLEKDVLSVDDFFVNYNGLTCEVDSTKVRNLYNAIILNRAEELNVETHVHLGDFFFDDFKHLMALDTQETEAGPELSGQQPADKTVATPEPRNWTYLIRGTATVNSVIVDSLPLEDFNIYQLHINDLSTLFLLTDCTYIADQFKFRVFEGEMNNSINYKFRNDGTQSVSTHHVIQNMNVRTMLRNMDNFGMDSVITYENISGLFSTDLNTFVAIDDSVLMDKMMVSGDIVLEKGGVYNYAPATEMSKFTGVKELDNIQFKTLRSSIFMFKNKLYVPRTNIVSNALDIAAFGMQSLDGDSEYHLEMHLGNILFGKSKRRNEKQDESGEEVDEKSLKKSSRKIRYTVTNGKSKVGLDTKDDREAMMNKIRVQQKMLDFIFFPKNIHYDTEAE